MDEQFIKNSINEFWSSRKEITLDDAFILEAAFYLEDVFGIKFTDDEINTDNLASPEAIEKTVLTKLNFS